MIYESSLVTGEVLEDWKVGNIVLLLKKDCKEKRGNNKPVSIKSVICNT